MLSSARGHRDRGRAQDADHRLGAPARRGERRVSAPSGAARLPDGRTDGRNLPLIDYSRGIRNPAGLSSTLAIVQSAHGPYDDAEDPDDGLLHYAYRSGDPDGSDNRKLRNAITTGMPLILFRKEQPNYYTPVAPVYVVDDVPEERAFLIALDESFRYMGGVRHLGADQRRYALRLAKQRLHQPAFRTRVLLAYGTQCAICQLRHGSLLDAAHIAPDSSEQGIPTTPNGLALCKIHHAAFDQNMLGISPDYEVHIDRDLLHEVDGPMLKHGLQEMHGRTLTLPVRRTDHPDRDLLAARWRVFGASA
ncbi:HNH endonuclease [Cellulomonas sp. zg-ZUI199]|uniref:HNH endonuclease n=1 Tax=Cellulomonas wangleii TaxID=2816956 RepID=A0ABX8D3N2_9CELL|nr:MULTISPECIES: HNH endonuclease [Cellulomonas]MBO0898944.1 HNH endonuclease [Cellulomonas sp. zg-ZUI22]MBO0923769.1 HNH endonuclease [Cellulomonas wangleii]MBO0924051.1 HNH endonuclease [Cellulomonas wangleii]QVI62077.1 HNH endonuclease [Cellulomonas wangleii]